MKNTKKSKPHVVKKQTQEINSYPVKSRPKLGLYIFLAVLVVAAALLVRKIAVQNALNHFKTVQIPEAVRKVLNNPNTKFEIGSVKDVSGIYEFELTLKTGTNQKYTSYLTKDGQILFVSGIKLTTLGKPTTQGATTKKLTCSDLKKTGSAQLTAFVVSNCPYGLQMQRVMKKAIDEQPALLNNLDVKYIGSIENGKITSMHGDNEAQENLRQICIREEQKPKYWDYLSCYMKEGKSEDCLSQTGVNATQLNGCIDDQSRGLAFAQKDFDMANKLQIASSPTLLLNDQQIVSEFDFGGRTANALKEVVCCGSNTKAGFCNKDLSKDDVATSFSLTGTASTGGSTGTGANCGTQ